MPTIGWAGSGSISSEINKIGKRLAAEYSRKNPDKTNQPLAVFSFHSSPDLRRRRVGFAVSELLMRHFVDSPSFVVVERALLDEVMEEQHLQSTGAIDSKTAAKVGQLTGAKVLLLGSVQKLGGKYHITARLVEVESGEVAALGYGELAISLFEAEAKEHLSPIRKKESIGFYLLYSYRGNSNQLPVATHTPPYGSGGTTHPKQFSISMVGLGIRYFPVAPLSIDLEGSFMTRPAEVAGVSGFSGIPLGSNHSLGFSTGYSIRGMLSWVHWWGRHTRSFLGGGVAIHRLGLGNDYLQDSTTVSPALRAGCEVKLLDRLGAAFFLNYDIRSATIRTSDVVDSQKVAETGKLYFGPSVALYF